MITNMIYILIPILISVETGNHQFPDEAIGKAGEVGRLQIRQSVVDDVNRIYDLNRKYNIRDAHLPCYASEMCYLYLLYWGDSKRLGREPTFEDLARIWNGGPKGYQKRSTISYWKKVNRKLQTIYCRDNNRQYAVRR